MGNSKKKPSRTAETVGTVSGALLRRL